MEKSYANIIVGVLLTILLSPQPGRTQPSEELKSLKREIENLKEGQKAIQKDLQEIKNRLQLIGVLPEEPKDLFLNIAGKPIKGNKNARLTLMEFSEYQ